MILPSVIGDATNGSLGLNRGQKILRPLVPMELLGSLKVYISDEVERKFREAAMRLYGYGRGSLSIASEKALLDWSSRVSQAMPALESIEDPVGSIYGLLSHVKKKGVELQHEATRMRARKK